jgi:hypothetical protein
MWPLRAILLLAAKLYRLRYNLRNMAKWPNQLKYAPKRPILPIFARILVQNGQSANPKYVHFWQIYGILVLLQSGIRACFGKLVVWLGRFN